MLHGHGAKGGAYARLARRTLRAKGQPIKAFYTPGGTLNYRPGTAQAAVFLTLERVLERFTDGLIFESAYAARVYGEDAWDKAPRLSASFPTDCALATSSPMFPGPMRRISSSSANCVT